jgi:hypothetical protein
MVARRFDTNTTAPETPGFFGQLFEMWRRLVTRCADALVALTQRLSPAEKPNATPRPRLLGPTVVWLGWGALLLGALAGAVIAPAGLARTLALWAGVQSVLWAVVRMMLMRLLGRGRVQDAGVLLGASSLGLVVYAGAVTPELRLAAWVASAAITWLALVRLGDERSDAARTVGIAWGAQALVVAASWIARNGVMAALTGWS